MPKKAFFQEATRSDITRARRIVELRDNLAERISALNEDDAAIIYGDLIPRRFRDAAHFMKHGQEVHLLRYASLKDARLYRRTPVQLRETAFNGLSSRIRCAYSFMPFIGKDKRKRKVSLVECLEGARIFAYGHQSPGTSVELIKTYDDAGGVEKDGAEITLTVPSRTKKQPRHGIKFISVPVEGTDRKVGIAHSISTDHTCGRKRFAIRYKDHDEKESSHVFTFCAHEIAAHLVILDFYMHTKKNMTPLEMNQFAIPTQETVDYYLNLMNRCLIQTSFDVDPRKLSKAEMEILLWDLVQQEGHDSTFFATKDPKEYRWQLAT